MRRTLATGLLQWLIFAAVATAQDVYLVNNWSQPSSMYSWSAGFTFHQTFTAAETATVDEVAVYAGNNQNPINVQLAISASGSTVYSNQYIGVRQRTTDWALSFPINPPTRVIRKGEVVTLSITPNTQMGVMAVLADNTSWPRSNLQGYGNVALKFYAKGTPPPPPPSANGKAYMNNGEVLNTGEYLIAANKAFFAIMQGDGNFCVYQGSGPADNRGGVWCSMVTAPGGVFYATQQSDGNFCVFPGKPNDGRAASWCTQKTAAAGHFFAAMNDNGDFVVNSGAAPTSTGVLWHDGIIFSTVALTAPIGGAIQWPDGKTCGTDCSRMFRVGSSVSVSAVPATGYTFKSWSGCASTTANPCVVSVTTSTAPVVLNLRPPDRNVIISTMSNTTWPTTAVPPLCFNYDQYGWALRSCNKSAAQIFILTGDGNIVAPAQKGWCFCGEDSGFTNPEYAGNPDHPCDQGRCRWIAPAVSPGPLTLQQPLGSWKCAGIGQAFNQSYVQIWLGTCDVKFTVTAAP